MNENGAGASKTWGQRLGLLLCRLTGWRIDVNPNLPKKYVVIGAPHTSNWDLVLTLLMMLTARVPLNWMAKDSIFRGPWGWAFRKVGGIPVDRSKRHNYVAQIVERFEANENFLLAIVPTGTRSKTAYWKSGFYHIAVGAGVPIALGYADFENKVAGIARAFEPTGDITADFEIIRDFYKDIKGRHPDLQSTIQLRPVE